MAFAVSSTTSPWSIKWIQKRHFAILERIEVTEGSGHIGGAPPGVLLPRTVGCVWTSHAQHGDAFGISERWSRWDATVLVSYGSFAAVAALMTLPLRGSILEPGVFSDGTRWCFTCTSTGRWVCKGLLMVHVFEALHWLLRSSKSGRPDFEALNTLLSSLIAISASTALPSMTLILLLPPDLPPGLLPTEW